MIGDAAIIFQRLRASRLFIQRRHGDVADFEQLRRGEEHHVGRVVVKRVDHAAFVDQHGASGRGFCSSMPQARPVGPAPTIDDVELLH